MVNKSDKTDLSSKQFALLFSQFLTWYLSNEEPIQVSGGLLEGVESTDGSYVAYYDVPYAKVTERFRDAIPDPKWNGVKKAIKQGIECAQRVNATSIRGIEDCLILNVYVPSTVSEKPRTVMVFFHGGGYIGGSSSPSVYGPDNFVKRDVILVTVNYRLDILGFLCLRNKEAPGNIGLKDQVEALRWVKRNIKAFGGDPDDVTIFGSSAGGGSVTYHMMSPMSQGLFSKVIIQSGSSLGFAFFQYDPEFVAHRFAAQLEQDTDNLQELAVTLATKSTRELLLTRVPRKIGDQFSTEFIFVPCIEKEISGIDRFLNDLPYTLLSKGKYQKVPTIIGFNNEEGYLLASSENDSTIRNLNFYDALPRDLDFPSITIKGQTNRNAKALYLPNEPISKTTLVPFSRYAGDTTFIAPVAITTDIFLATSDQPIYPYIFTHSGALNIAKLGSGFGNQPGATHEDELFYLFSNDFTPEVVPERDIDIIEKISTLWTNFAKYSKPTPEVCEVLPLQWLPADENKPQLFVIDNDLTTEPLWNERRQFWRSVYLRYRRRAYFYV